MNSQDIRTKTAATELLNAEGLDWYSEVAEITDTLILGGWSEEDTDYAVRWIL